MDQVKNETVSDFRALQQSDSPTKNELCIIQSLADSEPDVDAIYRLTNANYPVFFHPSSRFTASVVENGQIAPFNAQATLFFEDAFNVMLLPVT